MTLGFAICKLFQKFTKNAVEIGRTFSSLMMNTSFRHSLTIADSEEEFKSVLANQSSKYKADNLKSLPDESIVSDGQFSVSVFFKFD